MSEVAYELFVSPLLAAFTIPRGLDKGRFAIELTEALDGFTPRQLEEGVRWIRDNRKKSTCPTIAECREICAARGYVPNPSGFGSRRGWKTDAEAVAEARATDEARRIAAERLRDDPLAEIAREEGWLSSLLEYVTDQCSMPDARQAERIKAKSLRFDANLHREPRPTMYASLCDLRENMQLRAEREVFGTWPERQPTELPAFDEAERLAAEKRLAKLSARPAR